MHLKLSTPVENANELVNVAEVADEVSAAAFVNATGAVEVGEGR